MASDTDRPRDVPPAAAGADGLQARLQLVPPGGLDTSAPWLSFRRTRSVDVPWHDVYGDGDPVGVRHIRRYFEESWGVGPAVDPALANKLVADKAIFDATAAAPVYRARFTRPAAGTAPNPADAAKVEAEKITDGVVLRHGSSGRLYRVVASAPLAAKDFADPKGYADAWSSKVAGVVMVFDKPADVAHGVAQVDQIDLSPALILREYQELTAEKDFADAVWKDADLARTKMIDAVLSGPGTQDVSRFQEKFAALRMRAYDVQRRREILAQQAEELGYVLCLVDTPVKLPDGGEGPELKAGKLYRKYTYVYSWTVEHHSVGDFFSGNYGTDHYSQVTTGYTEVTAGHAPWVQTEAAFVNAGKRVFFFAEQDGRFLARGGETLEFVIDECHRNEAFRRNCVIFFPVYAETFTRGKTLTRYMVIQRPEPGIVPVRLPRIGFEEDLSYRAAWAETRLGALQGSIALGPGEEREVTLVSSFEQTSAVDRSTTSVLDIAQAKDQSLSTAMSNEFRRATQFSQSVSASESVSGFGSGLFGGGSSTQTESSSLSTFSRTVHSMAQSAASSVNRNQRQTVTATSQEETTVDRATTTRTRLKNVNEGRTLNLLLFGLDNAYDGGLFLDDIRFDVAAGVELIAGTGVFPRRTFPLSSLGEAMDLLATYTAEPRPSGGGLPAALVPVLGALVQALGEEYGEPGAGGGDPRTAGVIGWTEKAPSVPSKADGTTADAMVRDIQAWLSSCRILDRPAVSQGLVVPSGGLYVESMVGLRPGTEPYSEDMREAELAMRHAEIDHEEAKAEHLRRSGPD
ncbi:MAG: hypothetical protein H6906_09935 [Hyphomicrobiales bacterium]|nr:hypothetical protein [Hyphomicrobiales bacterium]